MFLGRCFCHLQNSFRLKTWSLLHWWWLKGKMLPFENLFWKSCKNEFARKSGLKRDFRISRKLSNTFADLFLMTAVHQHITLFFKFVCQHNLWKIKRFAWKETRTNNIRSFHCTVHRELQFSHCTCPKLGLKILNKVEIYKVSVTVTF